MKITQLNPVVCGEYGIYLDRRKVSENGIRFVWNCAYGVEEHRRQGWAGVRDSSWRGSGMIPEPVFENGIRFVWHCASCAKERAQTDPQERWVPDPLTTWVPPAPLGIGLFR